MEDRDVNADKQDYVVSRYLSAQALVLGGTVVMAVTDSLVPLALAGSAAIMMAFPYLQRLIKNMIFEEDDSNG